MRLSDAGEIEPAIVVGVWSSASRGVEYSPWHDGEKYARFLIDELIPRVNREFRTLGSGGNLSRSQVPALNQKNKNIPTRVYLLSLLVISCTRAPIRFAVSKSPAGISAAGLVGPTCAIAPELEPMRLISPSFNSGWPNQWRSVPHWLRRQQIRQRAPCGRSRNEKLLQFCS